MTTTTERRHLPLGSAGIRARGNVNGGSRGIDGYASVFNVVYPIGEFDELVEPGAFAAILADTRTKGLFNHDPDHLLGDVPSGTLRLREDTTGLKYEIDLGDVDLDRFILDRVARRMLTGSSFSFNVKPDGETWTTQENGRPLRRIKRFSRVPDVGPVTFPASESTVVAARSMQMALRARGAAPVTSGAPLSVYLERQRLLESEPPHSRSQPAPLRSSTRPADPWWKRWPNVYRAAVDRDLRTVRAIAYHEAGHALAAVLEGEKLERVGLRWEERGGQYSPSGGFCRHLAPTLSPRGWMAGTAASRAVGLDTWPGADSKDREWAGRLGGGSHEIERHTREAQELIGPHRHVLDTLVDLLVQDCELDGAEVERIVHEHMERPGPVDQRRMIPG